MYCTLDSDNNAACCAVGFNCMGEGSSTTSLASATSVGSGSTATGGSASGSSGMLYLFLCTGFSICRERFFLGCGIGVSCNGG